MVFIVIIICLFVLWWWYKKDKPKPGEKVLLPGGRLGLIRVSIDNGYVRYRGQSGESAMIPVKNITGINTTPNGYGKSDVVVIGQGTELARMTKLPSTWAEKTMLWLTTELGL